eukprot:2541824-Rhodomonas_salina.5
MPSKSQSSFSPRVQHTALAPTHQDQSTKPKPTPSPKQDPTEIAKDKPDDCAGSDIDGTNLLCIRSYLSLAAKYGRNRLGTSYGTITWVVPRAPSVPASA